MKKVLLAIAATAVASLASAEGYQVNSFSAKQEGMGHVGVAMKLGAESQIFNPAGLAFMDKTMEISGSVTGTAAIGTTFYEGNQYKTDNNMSTPLNFSAAFRIYDNLYAGVTMFTPYGSSINWGRNWPGAVLNQSVDMKVFTVQPTVSWRIAPNVSVGAGLMLSWGNIDLNKGLVSASSFDALLSLLGKVQGTQYQPYGEVSPAYVNLKGSTSLVAGFNIGAMWDINDQWTLGANYRSKMMMHVKSGDVNVDYANEQARTILEEKLKNLNYTNFNAKMPAPYVFTFGVSYKPISELILAFDAQLNGWSAYKQLDIHFANQEQFDQHLVKKYHNAMTYHLGAQYALTSRFDLRAGLMLDTSPCNKNYYNPETPGTTKIEPCVGFSFRPVPNLSIDLAFMYIHGLKVNDRVGEYDDFIAPIYNAALASYDAALAQLGLSSGLTPLPTTGTFKADYRVHAFSPAIGISYSF